MKISSQSIFIAGAKSDMARALARLFAKRRAHIQLAARRSKELDADIKDLKIRGAASVTAFELDIESPESIQKCIGMLEVLPEIVVCAVGYLGKQENTQKDFSEMQRLVAANFTGPAMLFERLAGPMEERGSGVLVGISSVAGERGRASNYWYGSAKSAFSEFLSGMRQRLHGTGVSVITVKPGFVKTAMTVHLKGPPLIASTPERVAADIIKAFKKHKSIIYTPCYWRIIMLILNLIPEAIFKRLGASKKRLIF